MDADNRALESAELLDEQQRDRAVARIRKDLELEGEAECRDCGDPIDVARRMALPSATRCFDCQEAHERSRRVR
jgi:phage/conjugal plasmid C-4 type zinc finger TraR family protein